MNEYNVSVSGGVHELDVPLHGHLGIEIRQSPVIPNPEGEATEEIYKMGLNGVIYEVADAEARATLPNKVDKEEGKGLSENDFTNTLKGKLDHIENGAEVNVQSDFAQSNNAADDFIKNKPTKLSDFDNDEGFIDNTVNNLVYYYLKSETYTQAEVNALIGAISTITIEVVESLPTTDIQTNVIYLTPKNPGEEDNIYDEYINIDGTSEGWEKIGDTEIDLSNYYTKSEADTLLGNKVDKVDGKGLSKNDYTDEDKALVGTIEDKLDKTENAIRSDALAIINPVSDNAPYIYRQTPVKESFKALMKKIVGASVVWNQIIQNGNFASTDGWSNVCGTLSVSNNVGSYTLTEVSTGGDNNRIYQAIQTLENHIYFSSLSWKPARNHNVNSLIRTADSAQTIGYGLAESGKWNNLQKIYKNTVGLGTSLSFGFNAGGASYEVGDIDEIKNVYVVDLTAMFGTTIADYVYTLETSQSGSGIAWLQSYGFFTEEYYAYKQNKLESGCVSAKKIYGKNLVFETLSGKNIESNGKITNNSQYDLHIAYVRKGITYTGKNCYLWGFFSEMPSVNSYSYNRARVLSGTQTFVAEISGYFVYRTEAGYLTPQVEIGNSSTTYTPYVEPTTYPISPITLRGLFKLSTDKLTVDGDEYNADGSVTRNKKYVKVKLSEASSSATLTDCKTYSFQNKFENNEIYNKSNGSGKSLCSLLNYQYSQSDTPHFYFNETNIVVYIPKDTPTTTEIEFLATLVTPTTEQTTPFTETEIVGSTEEFIDYEVAQSNRDVAIPVGTDTDYYQEMKLPSLPTTSGNHNLIYNVATGFGWS